MKAKTLKRSNTSKNLLIFFLVLLLILRAVLIFLYPNPGGDGPIYLSHTFTILNGHLFQNDLIKGYIPVFNFPYLYGLFNTPFYMPFLGTWFQTYSIFFWSITWVACFLASAFLLLKTSASGREKFVFFVLIVVLSIYSNSTRSEIFMLPFLSILIFCCRAGFEKDNNLYAYLVIPLLLAVIGLMHPVGGIFACWLVFLYILSKAERPVKTILIIFPITVLIVAALYLPVILIDYDAWLLNFFKLGVNQKSHSFLNPALLIKFLYYNPSFGLGLILILINAKNRGKEALIWISCFLIINYFQRSYYFPYLFALLLWRLYELPLFAIGRIWRLIAAACFLYGFIFGYVFPLSQQLENRGYGKAFKNIQAILKQKADSAGINTKIWVAPEMLMPIIDKRNVRVHWDFILAYKDYMPAIDTSNIFYLSNKDQLNYIGQFAFVKGTHLEITEVVKPVKGLVTLSRHFTRSDSLGLWQVAVLYDKK